MKDLKTSGKVPVLADVNLQITFSEAILEVYELRTTKPTGWEEKLLKLKHKQSELWNKIHSGKLDVACWSEPYSLEERQQELPELYKTRDLENNFEVGVDSEDAIDILGDIETLLEKDCEFR